MITRTQIIEWLKRDFAALQRLKLPKIESHVRAAIAELEKEAVQAEPVAEHAATLYAVERHSTSTFPGTLYETVINEKMRGNLFDGIRLYLHPAPKPADEQPVGDDPVTDYIIGLRRQIYMAENTILELQKRLDTPRPADPDLMALVDELEKFGMQSHYADPYDLRDCKVLSLGKCNCGAEEHNTKVRELAARIRKGVSE